MKDKLDKARVLFEKHLILKGLDFEWTGNKYKSINIQTKWRYFCLGYFANME